MSINSYLGVECTHRIFINTINRSKKKRSFAYTKYDTHSAVLHVCEMRESTCFLLSRFTYAIVSRLGSHNEQANVAAADSVALSQQQRFLRQPWKNFVRNLYCRVLKVNSLHSIPHAHHLTPGICSWPPKGRLCVCL